MTDRQPLEIAIVLPTLNEAANVVRAFEAIDTALKGWRWEAIFVDDNSQDGTADKLRALARSDPKVRVIERIGRRGLASACIEGALATGAPLVAIMDADGQHDAALLPRMAAMLREDAADIVIGSRFAEGGDASQFSAERLRNTRFATGLARRLTGVELSDPMSGFFMLHTERFRALAPRLSGIGFKILLDLLAAADRPMRVAELGYRFGEREAGESKLDRVIVLEYLVGLYDRYLGRIVPTRFALFGTIGALGVVVHLAILTLLFRTGLMPFVAATGAATMGAMTFNFLLNNALTYRDKRLSGTVALIGGWISFCLFCAIGAFANIAVATMLKNGGWWWLTAALAGILVGAVWNYALSSRFVWGRY